MYITYDLEISPSPSRCLSDLALGTSPRPREISSSSGMYKTNTSRQYTAVYEYNHIMSSLLPVNTKKYVLTMNIDSVKINTSLIMMRDYFSHPGGLGGKDNPVQADPTKQHSGTSPGENVTKSEGQPQLHRQCQHVQVFLNLLSNLTTHHPLFSSASVV